MEGRNAVLAQLDSYLGDVHGSPGAVCLLSGAPGLGKTHLAKRFLQRLTDNRPKLEGGAPPTGTPALLPICRAIGNALEGKTGAEARVAAEQYAESVPLLKEFLGPLVRARRETRHSQALSREVAPSETYAFYALLDLLQRIGGKSGAVFFLDDVQWLDASSVKFLGHVVEELRRLPVFFVLAARTNGVEPESISQIREAMSRPGDGHRHFVTLPPLSVGEVTDVAGRWLQGPLELSLDDRDWLADTCLGNPKYLKEVLQLLQDRGALTLCGGIWRLERPSGSILPPTLAEITLARFCRAIGDDAFTEDVLHLGAVTDRVFDARLVARAAQTTASRVISALSRIGRQTGLIRRLGGTLEFEFEHDLTREALLGALGDEATELHRRIADALRTDPSTPPRYVARHLRMAGDLAGAAEFLGQAATEALRHAAFSDADQLAMEEVGVLETLGVTEDDDRRLSAIEHRGAALMGAEKYNTVTELLHGIPSDSINPVYAPLLQLRGRAASRLPDHTSHERAVTDLRRGLKLAQSIESPAIASLWTDLVYAYDSVGDFPASKAAYRKALLIAQQERNTALLVRLQRISCIFFQPEQVVSTITKGLAVGRRLGLVYEHALSLNNLGAAYFHLRELDHAREAFGRSRDELQRLGGYRCDTPMNNLGLVALMEKRPDDARALLDAAAKSCRDPHSLIFIRSNIAALDCFTGSAAAAVRQLETLAHDADRTGDLFYRDCIRHNWAVALLDTGQAEQAMAVIQDCPVHFDAADEELIRGKRARLLVQIHAALGSESALQETVRREARVLDTTTRPVAWLYSQPWYLCDIEFWED